MEQDYFTLDEEQQYVEAIMAGTTIGGGDVKQHSSSSKEHVLGVRTNTDSTAVVITTSTTDNTGVVLIVLPFVILIGLFLIVVVLCKRRLHREIKFVKIGNANQLMMTKTQQTNRKFNISISSSPGAGASNSSDAPSSITRSAAFASKQEFEMAQSYSRYAWGIQERVINTLSAVEVKQSIHQPAQGGFVGVFNASSKTNSPAIPFIRTVSSPTNNSTTLRSTWYWKVPDESANLSLHYSPKPHKSTSVATMATTASSSTQNNSTPKKRKSDVLESHFKTNQSFFMDDECLDEYTTIHNRRDAEALLQERKSLLETQPISYKQFVQNSIIIIEQAAGLCYDLPYPNQLCLTCRQIIEYIRDRVGFSHDDCERYLKFFEKSSYSSDKMPLSEKEFELFSMSFLSILKQIDSFNLQTTLLQ